jgi:RNA polymerase sigma factor (TIGR02999 family)
MRSIPSADVTRLLVSWRHGDDAALERLLPIVYEELSRLAHCYMRRESPAHILQTTALVNEAYLRLIDASQQQWENRAHFFGICARMMRQILVDYARTLHRLKRGGNAPLLSLDEAMVVTDEKDIDLVALDDVLKALSVVEPRKSRVVELRFFGGLSVEESAEVLKVSVETVMRDWAWAKAWLYREIAKR